MGIMPSLPVGTWDLWDATTPAGQQGSTSAPANNFSWLDAKNPWKSSLKSPLKQYPLVNIQKAIENGHRNSEFSHEKKWWFSIAMLNYQRVPFNNSFTLKRKKGYHMASKSGFSKSSAFQRRCPSIIWHLLRPEKCYTSPQLDQWIQKMDWGLVKIYSKS